MKAVSIAAVVLTVMSLAFLVLLLVRRYLVDRSENRRLATEQRMRPLALELIAGRSDALPELDTAESDVLASLMARYARNLTGEARKRITDFFEKSGLADQEMRMLRSRRSWRRACAAWALGDMRTSAAERELLRVLEKDSSREVRTCAARSLGKLHSVDAVRPLLVTLTDHSVPRIVGAEAIREIGPPAVPALRELCNGPNRDMRAAALELLGYVGDADCAPSLIDAMINSRDEVRLHAVRALGRLGAADGTKVLRRALSDTSESVRAAAAQALGRVRDRECVEALLAQATDDTFDASRAAAQALAAIDPRLVLNLATDGVPSIHLLEAADMIRIRAG